MATRTVIGLLDTAEHAEQVVHALEEEGFRKEDVSLLMLEEWREREAEKTGGPYMRRGAITGGIAGGASALLATLTTVFIPGLGPLLVAGPILTLLGAMTGATIGAAVGEIADNVIPEERLRTYEERVLQGHVLIGVHTTDEDVGRAEALLARHGAQEIHRTV